MKDLSNYYEVTMKSYHSSPTRDVPSHLASAPSSVAGRGEPSARCLAARCQARRQRLPWRLGAPKFAGLEQTALVLEVCGLEVWLLRLDAFGVSKACFFAVAVWRGGGRKLRKWHDAKDVANHPVAARCIFLTQSEWLMNGWRYMGKMEMEDVGKPSIRSY